MVREDKKLKLSVKKKSIDVPSYNFNYFNVRNNAWEFLIKNKVNAYPLDLSKILRQNNWYVCDYQTFAEYKHVSRKEVVKLNPDGFTAQDVNKNFLICYNEQNTRQRIRFTICHEIGHIVLGHLYKGEKLEKEANMFAARILMPMILIKELKINAPSELAKLCDVSIEAAQFRLKRYEEIRSRERFYTNPLEKQLYKQLKDFLEKQ